MRLFPAETPPARRHAEVERRGDRFLGRADANPDVRRWRPLSRQTRLVHAPGSHAARLLREAHVAGGRLALTRARAEHPEVQQLVADGHVVLHPQPEHHMPEFSAELTPSGRKRAAAEHAAGLAGLTGHQAGLFKAVRLILRLRKARQLGLFGGAPTATAVGPRGPGPAPGKVVAHETPADDRPRSLPDTGGFSLLELDALRSGSGVMVPEYEGEPVLGSRRTQYRLRRFFYVTPKGAERIPPVEVLQRRVSQFTHLRSKSPPFYDMGNGWKRREAVEYLHADGRWRQYPPSAMAVFKDGRASREVGGEEMEGTYKETVPCDERCTGANGRRCECSCGGANHGKGNQLSYVNRTPAELRVLIKEHGRPEPALLRKAAITRTVGAIRAGGQSFRQELYHHPEVPDAELQVVHRADGRRSVATFHLPEASRGKGHGQAMLLHALSHGPISAQSRNGVSDAYRRVQTRLVEKGHIHIQHDQFGEPMMHLGAAPMQKAAGDGGTMTRPPAPAARVPPGVATRTQAPAVRPKAPPSVVAPSHVQFRHPETGEARSGQVTASGARGVTVVDHETGLTHKVAHGGYVATQPAKRGPGTPGRAGGVGETSARTPAPNYRETHPGLNKYPTAGIQAEEGKAGEVPWKLRWTDPKGVTRYGYETSYLRANAQEKFGRITGMGGKLAGFRETMAAHMAGAPDSKHAVLATMSRLVDHTAMRPGNEESAAKENTHGASTLLKKHVQVKGDAVHLNFLGKDKVPQEHVVRDPRVAAVVRHLQSLPGDRLFQHRAADGSVQPLKASDLNDYVSRHLGEEHSIKDLRTWHATRAFSEAADKLGPPKNEEDAEAKIQQAALASAQLLGHKRTVNRSQWVHSDRPKKELEELAGQHGGLHVGKGVVGFQSARERKAFEKAHGEGLGPAAKPDGLAPEWRHDGATALDNYIDPTVVAAYRKGLTLSGGMRKAQEPSGRGHLSDSERRFLGYLDRVRELDPYHYNAGEA